jgi:acetolactate synthase small subunit
LPAYSYYACIAAIDAQEPMSGMTVAVQDSGSEAVAKRVKESSRYLYAKKTEDEQVINQKLVIIAKTAKPSARQKTNTNTQILRTQTPVK